MELDREDNGDVGPMVERLTVTVEEATVMLGISRTTAYGCASRNEIPPSGWVVGSWCRRPRSRQCSPATGNLPDGGRTTRQRDPTRARTYTADMARRADDLGDDSSILVANPEVDTSVEAVAAWIDEIERADDWLELRVGADQLIADDRSTRGS